MRFKTKVIWYPSSNDGVSQTTVHNDGTYRREGEFIQYTMKETELKFIKWDRNLLNY